MADPSLIVIAEVHGIVDGLAQFDELIAGLVAGSVDEPDCMNFRVLRTDQPGEIVLLSEWASEAGMQAHYSTPHYRYYASEVGPLLVRPSEVVVHHIGATVHPVASATPDPRALG
jgi:quinol monooxygenase YgiN